MSTKLNSAESSYDEQKSEASDAVFQQVDSPKHGKFASLSDTTLHDLPREMLERILVEAVAMEVKGMKLAKTVWREKADLVISRLTTVCSQWSSILTTDFFRNELHRALDGIAQETIRLEIVHQSHIGGFILDVTTLKDEILIFCGKVGQYNNSWLPSSFNITVYDRNNMAEVKDVIALPGIRARDIAACNVSNCVYVQEQNQELHCSSVLRIARDEEHQFKMQTWLSDLAFAISEISVSDKGGLIIVSRPELPEELNSVAVNIYSPNNGFLIREVLLSPTIYGFLIVRSVIQKSNGNLVLASLSEQFQTVLTETGTDGIIERQYTYSRSGRTAMSFADTSGRILINDRENGKWKMLDSELNLLDFTGPQPYQDEGNFNDFRRLHYDSERNEVVGFHTIDDYTTVLTIFRSSEE